MQTTEQDNARRPANLDEIALRAATEIMAIDRADLEGGDVQHKARIQTIVRDALDTHTPAGTAVYWHQRHHDEMLQTRILAQKLARAERALKMGGYVDNGAEEWEPPLNEIAGELHRKLFKAEDEIGQLRGLMQTMKDQAERDGYQPEYEIDKLVELTGEPGVEYALEFPTFKATAQEVIAAGINALREASRTKGIKK